jgi:membrane protein
MEHRGKRRALSLQEGKTAMASTQTAHAARALRLSEPRPRGWWPIVKRTWREASEDNLGLIASGIAFNVFLALIPLLTGVVLTYGLVASVDQVAGHIAALADVLPQEAAGIIGDQLQNMVASAGRSTGIGLALALGLALFGALRGANGIVTAMNIVYNIPESRSLVRTTGLAIAIILGLMVLFLLASAALSVLNMLENLLPDLGGLVHTLLQIGFWIGAASVACFVIALIYAYAPDRPHDALRSYLPGALVATAVWIAATIGFSFYVRNFADYNATYGALGAVIIFLTWLYLSAYILLLGAELNQVLRARNMIG